MRDTLVRCGGAQARRRPAGQILDLDVDAPKDSPARVRLSLNHITEPMVSNLPDALADLVEIACYVYSADQFTQRGSSKMTRLGQHWRRHFRFVPSRIFKEAHRRTISNGFSNSMHGMARR